MPNSSKTDTRDDALAQATRMLARARRVLVLTGAGLSADSGLPTYRGVGGLYDHELTDDGIAIEDALSGPMFQRDPGLTWKYIAQIESACRDAQANAGHYALARMAPRYERFCVLTQNVDGFHRDAGGADLIEMHGNIHRLHCTYCAHAWTVVDYAHIAALPPRCDRCRAVVRPAVVLFGEWLAQDAIERYESALRQGFDLVMAVGTSAVFPYIVAPVRDTWQRGGDTLEINPQATDISPCCRVAVRQGAADALTRIERALAAGGWHPGSC